MTTHTDAKMNDKEVDIAEDLENFCESAALSLEGLQERIRQIPSDSLDVILDVDCVPK